MPLNFLAKAILTVAMEGANYALTASRRIEGPRLDSLKFTSGDYGAALPNIMGMRRISAPIFWAEDLKEVKSTQKTKGGKYNQYKYYGTWAVAINDGLIDSVRRIWFDEHLVYDMSGAGPVTPFDFGGRGNIEDFIAIYLGTADQVQDARMQATVEAKHGVGSCPGYRNLAYIVFKDVPLEKLGNRIPQCDVEVITSATPSIPSETRDLTYAPNNGFDVVFSPDFARLAWITTGPGSGGYEIWDVAARAPMIAGTAVFTTNSASAIGVYADGMMLFVNGDDIYSMTVEGVQTVMFTASPHLGAQQDGVRVIADGAGGEHWGTYPFANYTSWYFDGVKYSPGWQACLYFADRHGNVWVVGREPAAGSTTNMVYFLRLVTIDNSPGYLDSFSVALPHAAGPAGEGEGVYAAANADGHFVINWDQFYNYLIDPTDGAILASASAGAVGHVSSRKTVWSNLVPGAGTIWLGNSEYDLLTGGLIRTETSIPASAGGRVSVYDPINHALILNTGSGGSPQITWYYLDRTANNGVTLADICSAVAEKCGVASYDFSDLDQVIPGWSWTQGQASNILEPLLDGYDSDFRPHDFAIEGLKRSGTSLGSLAVALDFAKADPRYTVTIQQAAELPIAVTINFADIAADQQPNNTRASRPLDATDARGEKTLDMTTLAIGVDDARALGDRYFRRVWNERRQPKFAVTAQQLGIEPADCLTLDIDGESDIYRLTRMTVKADQTVDTEWKYDHPSLALTDSASGAAFDGRDPSTVAVPLLSKGFVLDIPLLEDVDNSSNPLIYYAASPFASGAWPGATIYEEVGGEYTTDIADVASSDAATWGYATDALADVPSPWCWDRGNTVNVALQYGTLTGCTEADIDADPRRNLCLLGDELLNFTTASLQGDGSYTLAGLRRGRRGTEWATGAHAIRDVFLMLDKADTADMGLSDVGNELSFKAVTTGRTTSGAFPIPVAPFSGNSLKPYAPADVRSVKESNGDWTISWKWRTRVGGDFRSGVAPSSAEASLSFHVTVGDGTSSAIKTASSSPYTWTQADQITDTGAEVAIGDLHVSVAEISAAIGDGWATALAA